MPDGTIAGRKVYLFHWSPEAEELLQRQKLIRKIKNWLYGARPIDVPVFFGRVQVQLGQPESSFFSSSPFCVDLYRKKIVDDMLWRLDQKHLKELLDVVIAGTPVLAAKVA